MHATFPKASFVTVALISSPSSLLYFHQSFKRNQAATYLPSWEVERLSWPSGFEPATSWSRSWVLITFGHGAQANGRIVELISYYWRCCYVRFRCCLFCVRLSQSRQLADTRCAVPSDFSSGVTGQTGFSVCGVATAPLLSVLCLLPRFSMRHTSSGSSFWIRPMTGSICSLKDKWHFTLNASFYFGNRKFLGKTVK